jgi:hypothetical protein
MNGDDVSDVKTIKSMIHTILGTIRKLFDADICALYLTSPEMDEDEQLEILNERLAEIRTKYEEKGMKSQIPKELEDRTIGNFEILKFIDVAERVKMWKFSYEEEQRPCKYVIFKNFKAKDSILHEGLTAFIFRLQEDRFFDSESGINNHLSTAHLNSVKRNIHPPCSMMIGLILKDDENNTPIGIVEIENYSERADKKHLFTESQAKQSHELKEAKGYFPLLLKLIKRSKSFYKNHSYGKLFGGMKLLDCLKNLQVDGLINQKIHKDTKHLFYVLKRYEYVGYEQIMNRVLHYAQKTSETLDIADNFSFQQYMERFKQQEDLMLYQLKEYRDHFMHQFHVFITGYIILNKIKLSTITGLVNQRLATPQSQKLFDTVEPLTYENVLRIWFLTSFFHDFAYILQEFDKGMSNFLHNLLGYRFRARLNWWQLLRKKSPFPNNLVNLVRYFLGQDAIDPLRLLPDFLWSITGKIDHGVAGALLLMEKLGECAPVKKRRDCHIAAASICLHNEDIYRNLEEAANGWIPFETLPFAHILAFCDTAQCWGRTARVTDKNEEYVQPKFHDIKYDEGMKHMCCEVLYTSEILKKIPNHGTLSKWTKGRPGFFRSRHFSFVIKYLKDIQGTISPISELKFEKY